MLLDMLHHSKKIFASRLTIHLNHCFCFLCIFTALAEEPDKSALLEKDELAASTLGRFSAKEVHMAASMHETSFRSTSLAEMKFASASAYSTQSLTAEIALSSSSIMEMSSHLQIEGSSKGAITQGKINFLLSATYNLPTILVFPNKC